MLTCHVFRRKLCRWTGRTPTIPSSSSTGYLPRLRHCTKVSLTRRRSCHSDAKPRRIGVFPSHALTPVTQCGSWAQPGDHRAKGFVPDNSCASFWPAWQNTSIINYLPAVDCKVCRLLTRLHRKFPIIEKNSICSWIRRFYISSLECVNDLVSLLLKRFHLILFTGGIFVFLLA